MNWKRRYSHSRRSSVKSAERWYKKHGHLTRVEKVKVQGKTYHILWTVSADEARKP